MSFWEIIHFWLTKFCQPQCKPAKKVLGLMVANLGWSRVTAGGLVGSGLSLRVGASALGVGHSIIR